MKRPIFYCDNCNKCFEETDGTFPYDAGWIYLYGINFKVADGRIIDIKDKHFCGSECITGFLRKLIHKEIEEKERGN